MGTWRVAETVGRVHTRARLTTPWGVENGLRPPLSFRVAQCLPGRPKYGPAFS